MNATPDATADAAADATADATAVPAPPDAPTLAQLQACFAEAVVSGSALSALPALQDAPQAPADVRLGIYAHAYRARLTEALADLHERTHAWLGDESFEALAHAYIDAHPPRGWALRDFGRGFAGWLAGQLEADDGEVAELAALDAALRQAFDGADRNPLDAAALAGLAAEDWDSLGFDLHPAVQLLAQRFNTVQLWSALQAGTEPPAPRPLDQALTVLVWRLAEQPHFRSLEPAEAHALAGLMGGGPFAAACTHAEGTQQAAAACTHAEGTQQAAAWLQRWLADGLLCGLQRGLQYGPLTPATRR